MGSAVPEHRPLCRVQRWVSCGASLRSWRQQVRRFAHGGLTLTRHRPTITAFLLEVTNSRSDVTNSRSGVTNSRSEVPSTRSDVTQHAFRGHQHAIRFQLRTRSDPTGPALRPDQRECRVDCMSVRFHGRACRRPQRTFSVHCTLSQRSWSLEQAARGYLMRADQQLVRAPQSPVNAVRR